MKAKPVGGGGGYKKPKKQSTAGKIVGAVGNAAYSGVMGAGKPIGWAVDKAHPYDIAKGVKRSLGKITDSKGPPAGSFMSTKPKSKPNPGSPTAAAERQAKARATAKYATAKYATAKKAAAKKKVTSKKK